MTQENNETAGRKLYVYIVDEFQSKIDFHQRYMNEAAIKFADTMKEEDRTEYLRRKDSLSAWQQAKQLVAQSGHALVQLVEST